MSTFEVLQPAELDPDVLLDVLLGMAPVLHVPSLVSPSKLGPALSAMSARCEVRTDGVEAQYVGAFHYGKTLEDYANEVAATATDVSRIAEATDVARIRELVRQSLRRRGYSLRLASLWGTPAGAFTFRRWTSDGYCLEPHEDIAQLTHPAQRGFEVQSCRAIASVCVCLSNPDGCAVECWNVRPTAVDRSSLGLDYTGHPYPLEWLAPYPTCSFVPRPGDLYIIQPAFVHGIRAPVGGGTICTGGYFLGLLGSNEIVEWT